MGRADFPGSAHICIIQEFLGMSITGITISPLSFTNACSTAMWKTSGLSVTTALNHSHGFQDPKRIPKALILCNRYLFQFISLNSYKLSIIY